MTFRQRLQAWRQAGLPKYSCNNIASVTGLACQAGVGLIEVLVALLLLSTSLLGMGMLQVKTLQYQRASYSDTMAQLLVSDMAERIQSNLGALAIYDSKATDTIAANPCTDNCNPEKRLVERDLHAWKASIEQAANAGLTEGKGKISVDTSTSPQQVTLSIQWKEALKDIKNKDDKSTSRVEFTFEVQP